MPLADRIRPKSLDEVVGQSHLLKQGRPLRKIIDSGYIPNMIFYGSSGIGKTTVANIIAQQTNMTLHKLNGTSASTADIKQIISEVGTLLDNNGILLYLDEIQYLNKKQQQNLLEYIENGNITLIASTTENPYFYIYGAILSRSTIFEFKPVEPKEIIPAIERGFHIIAKEMGLDIFFENKDIENEVMEIISFSSGGDVRKALNTVELCTLASENGLITAELAKELGQKSSMKYDRDGDRHYDILSAFQKSIRGSDENAALHYLAKLVLAGDMASICRRLLVIAAEDIGLAFPNAVTIVKSCVDSALQLGFPEARIPLAEAVILLCTSPKSNSVIIAIDSAIYDVEKGDTGDIPAHLKDSHYNGAEKLGHGIFYKYSHDYKNHWVKQQYLPDKIKNHVYYNFGDNKLEQAAFEYRKKITSEENR